MGRVGNNSRTHPPLLSRHLTLQNLRNINFFLISQYSMPLMHAWWFMAHGSRLMAHGQGRPGEAHGSWPDACPALGTQRRASGPGPAMSHEPPLASLGHEPWPLSHEPWTIKHASRVSNIEKSRKLMFLRFCKVRCRENKRGWVLELFPTLPTYQNPINMNPGPLLCKVSWFFGFSIFCQVFSVCWPYRTLKDHPPPPTLMPGIPFKLNIKHEALKFNNTH